MHTLMTVFPRHVAPYHCTTSCDVREGEQRYEWTPLRLCKDCGTAVDHDTWFEELGMCLDCSNAYWNHDDEKEDK